MSGAYTYSSGMLLCISSPLIPQQLWVTHALEPINRWVVILKMEVLIVDHKLLS
jgi:hypothetical protein